MESYSLVIITTKCMAQDHSRITFVNNPEEMALPATCLLITVKEDVARCKASMPPLCTLLL